LLFVWSNARECGDWLMTGVVIILKCCVAVVSVSG